MPWNWELPDWPKFHYKPDLLIDTEKQFLLNVGSAFGYLKTIEAQERAQFTIEILSSEGLESARIEGEILDRGSLQSSIRKHFGFQAYRAQEDFVNFGSVRQSQVEAERSERRSPAQCGQGKKEDRFGTVAASQNSQNLTEHGITCKKKEKESRMAKLLCDVYESFDQPLTHEMLARWHFTLFENASNIENIGNYRSHTEPMQIVSNRYGSSKVFFEAPPSERVFDEMTNFINWFNSKNNSKSMLGKAAIAHIYFESIHPFEDGNGRIGRLLVEKFLSQSVGQPILIAVSKLLEKQKKEYYANLETCNQTLDAQHWVKFFSSMILQAHEESTNLLYFLIQKSKMLNALSEQINARKTKVLLRMFAEGPTGFKGGLSAENYIAITKTTRATATRDLTDLVEKGALIKTGELRHTRYRLNLQNNIP